jgi:hypothetical protein
VRDADGGISRVDGLASGTGGAEGVNAQVFGFDFDVYVFGFGKNGDGDGGSVDAALLLSSGRVQRVPEWLLSKTTSPQLNRTLRGHYAVQCIRLQLP